MTNDRESKPFRAVSEHGALDHATPEEPGERRQQVETPVGVDRSEPPQGYEATWYADCWVGEAVLGSEGLGMVQFSRDAAVAACWAHHDRITAPYREAAADIEYWTRTEAAAARMVERVGQERDAALARIRELEREIEQAQSRAMVIDELRARRIQELEVERNRALAHIWADAHGAAEPPSAPPQAPQGPEPTCGECRGRGFRSWSDEDGVPHRAPCSMCDGSAPTLSYSELLDEWEAGMAAAAPHGGTDAAAFVALARVVDNGEGPAGGLEVRLSYDDETATYHARVDAGEVAASAEAPTLALACLALGRCDEGVHVRVDAAGVLVCEECEGKGCDECDAGVPDKYGWEHGESVLPATPTAPKGPNPAALAELVAEYQLAGDEWAAVRLATVAGLHVPPSAPQGPEPGRPHHLVWSGVEWVDERCGCRYHPDDDNRSHGGAPHVHHCKEHSAAAPHGGPVLGVTELMECPQCGCDDVDDLDTRARCLHCRHVWTPGEAPPCPEPPTHERTIPPITGAVEEADEDERRALARRAPRTPEADRG